MKNKTQSLPVLLHKAGKKTVIIFFIISSFALYAQVGIGTKTPQGALDVVSSDSGMVLPRVANTAAVVAPINGMLIYDLSSNCLKAYENGSWTDCLSGPAIQVLDCAGATLTGTLQENVAANSVSVSINYSGGDGSSHAGQTVNSTVVTGLTATLSAGNFNIGTGTLTYNITGTPSSSGDAEFALDIGGLRCSVIVNVQADDTIPTTITIAQNRNYFITSVFDQDYFPYVAPTAPATTNAQAAGGGNEPVTINIQGLITTIGKSFKIPVTTTGSGTLPAFSQTITVPSNLTEDNISRDLTLSWSSQNYTISTKVINAKLASNGSTLNVKKLDLNAGLGNDYLGILLGTFTYEFNNAGNTTNLRVRAVPGIPDRAFGDGTHDFLYIPVIAEDGINWLNHNLGAHYTNIHHANFNPEQRPVQASDHLGYGSFYQGGRFSDGHEIITWTSWNSGTGSSVTNVVSNSDTPGHSSYINNGTLDWRSPQNTDLWVGVNGTNNPCPSGYRLPAEGNYTNLFNIAAITNRATAHSSTLAFTAAGERWGTSGEIRYSGAFGYYRTSTYIQVSSYWLPRRTNIGGTSAIMTNGGNQKGLSVRCIFN